MKKYFAPEIEVTSFKAEDIITASGGIAVVTAASGDASYTIDKNFSDIEYSA